MVKTFQHSKLKLQFWDISFALNTAYQTAHIDTLERKVISCCNCKVHLTEQLLD